MNPIYLDYNATTPLDPEVIEAMRPFLEGHFGNPSSSHAFGVFARNAVENARAQVASLLHCSPEEVVFTGGGTESNNTAIRGLAFARRERGNHIITTWIEHPAVLEVCACLETQGFTVTYLPVDASGMVSATEVEKAVTPQTILITIMHANNEVGTIQPIEEISRFAKARDIAVHTDAAQSAGKIPADVERLGIDLLSVAGHKLYAPKGVGALYIRRGIRLEKLMHGAAQEQGRRPGTENVLEIVGLGKACEIARRDLEKNRLHMHAMRERLHRGLMEKVNDIQLNGHAEHRLPNTLSIGFSGVDADRLLAEMNDTVAASAGAACHSSGDRISSVLQAMQVPETWARGTVRFSVGRMTSESEIDQAVRTIAEAVAKPRGNPERIQG